MSDQLSRQLKRHRDDYQAVHQKPFNYFYCPILHRDENGVELQRGHILNEAFKGSPKRWVVQRKDVDNFYGTLFEAKFVTYQYADDLTLYTAFSNKALSQHVQPRLFFKNHPIEAYPYRGGPLRPGFNILEIRRDGDGSRLFLRQGTKDIFKPSDAEVFHLAVRLQLVDAYNHSNEFSYVNSLDIGLPALVSLIKAAHLTMFSLFGYRYATSSAGVFVGRDILGTFFERNKQNRSRGQVLKNAVAHFSEFRHMVRPLLAKESLNLNTLTDGNVWFCADSTDDPWGLVTFVKTANKGNAVLLPIPGDADLIAKYLSFLNNSREVVYLTSGRFDLKKQEWEIRPDRYPHTWIKSDCQLAP